MGFDVAVERKTSFSRQSCNDSSTFRSVCTICVTIFIRISWFRTNRLVCVVCTVGAIFLVVRMGISFICIICVKPRHCFDSITELGVLSPLLESGFTKQDIRAYSREINLRTWDKPAYACLSSRFPYGTAITLDRVKQVGQAEESLKSLGFRVLRVRYHGDVARLELGPEELSEAVGPKRDQVVSILKQAGFTYVSVDLEGYRTGSMN